MTAKEVTTMIETTKTEMSEAAKEAKREYERRWRKENPDKVKAIRSRYWEKRALRQKDVKG